MKSAFDFQSGRPQSENIKMRWLPHACRLEFGNSFRQNVATDIDSGACINKFSLSTHCELMFMKISMRHALFFLKEGTHVSPGRRIDIQMLRALAVTCVILFHAGFAVMPAGYLGVDIFFVISGYLITSIIKRQISDGVFRLSDFYCRRAMRLLPSAYATFILTALASIFLLTPAYYRDFLAELIGATTYTINFLFWQTTGYFSGAGELRPLLHIWSLAVEEQYYLLAPTFLMLTPPRYWKRGTLLLVLVSAALCFGFVATKPNAAFYLLPARAWELGIGALATFVGMPEVLSRRRDMRKGLVLACLLLVIGLPFHAFSPTHPGIDTVLICLATAGLLLLGFNPGRSAPALLLAKVGDYSYVLYLVHWPIFALIRNCYIGPIDFAAQLLALGLTGVIALLVRRFVEIPFQQNVKSQPSRKLMGAVLTGSFLAACIPALAYSLIPPPHGVDAVGDASPPGSSFVCAPGAPSQDRACSAALNVDYFLWGDSFAMHLLPGLRAQAHGPVGYATRVNCPPFQGVAPLNPLMNFDMDWARKCIDFNQSTLEHLKADASIKTVLLASSFDQFLGPLPGRVAHPALRRSAQGFDVVATRPALAAAAVEETIEELRRAGKKVILIRPPPSSGVDIARCAQREFHKLPMFGQETGCAISKADYLRVQGRVLDFIGKLQRDTRVTAISYDDVLCDQTRCITMIGGVPLYRDSGHLSYEGSLLIAQRLEISQRIQNAAF